MKEPSPSPTVIQQWINDVNDSGKDLSSWEKGFMESITDQWDTKHWLSATQLDIVERIYTDKVK